MTNSRIKRKAHAPVTKETVLQFIKVEEKSGCWLWQRHCLKNGYGQIFIDGKQQYAHRVAYRLWHGEVPLELMVCHRCDTPACVNPAHLFLGTAKDNVADMHSKKRAFSPMRGLVGEDWPGSKLTNDQIREIKNSSRGAVELASRLNVTRHTIWAIRTGRSHKNV